MIHFLCAPKCFVLMVKAMPNDEKHTFGTFESGSSWDLQIAEINLHQEVVSCSATGWSESNTSSLNKPHLQVFAGKSNCHPIFLQGHLEIGQGTSTFLKSVSQFDLIPLSFNVETSSKWKSLQESAGFKIGLLSCNQWKSNDVHATHCYAMCTTICGAVTSPSWFSQFSLVLPLRRAGAPWQPWASPQQNFSFCLDTNSVFFRIP